MIYETLEPIASYHTDRTAAIVKSNMEGGAVWKRRDDAPSCIKPWAVGELSESRKEWYSLFQTAEGRQP